MKKFDFKKIAISTFASSASGIVGVEVDLLASKMPIPKPIIQIGKIAASIAATFFMPKAEFVQHLASGMIGQSSAELYKSISKRGAIGEVEDSLIGDSEMFVNENGVRSDSDGNPLIIEGIGMVDAEGNQVDEDGNILAGVEDEEMSNSLVN